MTTPTPAPAPMTAGKLKSLRETTEGNIRSRALRGLAPGSYATDIALLDHIDALTSRVSRLLEAVEGAEKALARLDVFWTAEFPEGPENPEPWGKIDVRLSEETIAIWCGIRSALATLRAAREGA